MEIGMIGLGRMGANIVRRLVRQQHRCVVFDRSPQAVNELVADNAQGAASLRDIGMQTAVEILGTYAGREFPKDALKGKIVLMGATAVGIYDLRVTPFSGVVPGVEIQATVIDNILRDRFLRTPSFPQFQSLLVVLGLGLFLGLALPRLSAVWSFLVLVLVLSIFLGINYLLFKNFGWQVELIYPLLEIGGVYTGVTVQRFLREERERLRIKKTFQAYVAPEVVNEILKHPDLLGLGGDRRVLTILFSDIRGFTTIAESQCSIR